MMPKSVKRFSDDIMLYFFDLDPAELKLLSQAYPLESTVEVERHYISPC